MNTRRNTEAVSPVVGTILMVAITLILAAVVSAATLSIPENMQKTRLVTATATQDGGDIRIVYQGGIDDGPLMYIAITTPGNDVTGGSCIGVTDPWYTLAQSGGSTGSPATMVSSATVPAGTVKPNVGAVYTLVGCGSGSQNHVVIIGHFGEGTDQIILDTYV